MDALTEKEVWRSIPPEEKFELMAKAHASGISAAIAAIMIACTAAVALKIDLLMWSAIICSPFVFQIAAGRAWKYLRPRIMLEYLAARSAARRYAYSLNAKDLSSRLLFRGTIEEIFKQDLQDGLETILDNTRQSAVWVSLFADSFIIMAENPGGAELKVGGLLTDPIEIKEHHVEDEDSRQKSLSIKLTMKGGRQRRFVLSSRYPAALTVFDKRLHAQKEILVAARDLIQLVPRQ